MAQITIKNLHKSFGKAKVLSSIDLTIKDGELVVLLGPSGCGKTTLLNIVAGLLPETSGEIYFDEKKVNHLSPAERDIGFVFQNYALYPDKSVYENLAFGLKFKSLKSVELREYLKDDPTVSKAEAIGRRIREIAAILQIDNILRSKPHEISGGQRQRVAIGRAMVRKPRVFLFDEPLSNLDAILRVSMREEIRDIHREIKSTMIYVTHDQAEAMTLADRIVVMHEGRILQIGTPGEIYGNPANVFVAGFIGSPPMNLFPARIEHRNDKFGFVIGGSVVPIPAIFSEKFGRLIGKPLIFGIRPEDLSLRDQFAVTCNLSAVATSVDFLGNMNVMTAKFAGHRLSLFSGDQVPYEIGKPVRMYLNMQNLHLFEADSERRIDAFNT